MRFTETPIPGAFVVELELASDERGHFARTFDAEEFARRGLHSDVVQENISFNRAAGTLRGMHLQVDPAEETKLVRCTRGVIWDVIVDLREESPAYLRHFALELSADNHRMLYVPGLCAHGFQTLADETEVAYQMGDRYRPGHGRGVAHDDPAFGIEWPLEVSVIDDKDRAWPWLADRGGDLFGGGGQG